MKHPRTHAWKAAAATAAGGLGLAGLRTATGRPVRSAPTLAAAGAGLAAGGLMAYEWLTPRSWLYGPVFWHARTDELVVALATVKKHVSHVLDKLGAANRTQAVARARELGLLR